jgi:mannose-6-phosphate isomerase-like protein (cupin superfamily)
MVANTAFVRDISALAGDPVHTSSSKALVHQVDAAETSLFRVRPGGRIAAHVHSKVWDLFIGVSGEGEIEYQDDGGTKRVDLLSNSFCGMPPGVKHEVRNRSDSYELVFILIHAPYEGYDHVPS